MLTAASDLVGYAIGATDGEIGRVLDVRLDDRRWALTSLVVDAGRLVLVSACSIERVDPGRRVLCGALSRTQIVNGAHVDTDRSGRSGRALTAHYLQGLDAEIGRVADFFFDDRTWRITHLIVAVDPAPPERRVIVPVGWVSWVSWDARQVMVALTSDKVTAAPRYDGGGRLESAEELRVAAYYGHPPFARSAAS